MSPLILPTRMRLTRSELAAAIRDGKSARGEALDPETREALRAAVAPVRLVVVEAAQAGARQRTETRFALAAQGSVTAQAASNGALDLALLPSVTLAVVMADDLLGLSSGPAMTGPAVGLAVDAFATLCAAADAMQAATLRARLERSTTGAAFALDAAACERTLADGLAGDDTRWAVTAARFALPVDLAAAKGRCADGLRALESAGLVKGASFTAPGEDLARTLAQITSCGRVTLVAGGDVAVVAPLGVIRTVTAIWFCAHDAATGRITLAPVTVAGAFEAVRRMFEGDLAVDAPAAASGVERAAPATAGPDERTASATAGGERTARFCSSCGAALSAGARFCGDCGAPVPGAAGR